MLRRDFLQLATLSLLMPAVAASADPRSAKEQETLLASFRKSFDRPRVPLEPGPPIGMVEGGILREKYTVASEAGVRVPVLVLRKAGGDSPRPVVIALHGLGGNKEGLMPYLLELAQKGFVAVGLDARYHGERGGDIQAAMATSFVNGKEHPYLWDTVWDTWRVMDHLQKQAYVDPERIGVIGFSLGGHTTWMVCADPRVKVAVPCISVCSWRWQLEHQGYTQRVTNLKTAFDAARVAMGESEINRKVVAEAWKRWLPGVPEKFDCQDILGAFAPRPLLMINGDSDPVAPLEGLRVAETAIKQAYAAAGAADRVRLDLAEKSGHTVTPAQRKAMVEWLERWLKP